MKNWKKSIDDCNFTVKDTYSLKYYYFDFLKKYLILFLNQNQFLSSLRILLDIIDDREIINLKNDESFIAFEKIYLYITNKGGFSLNKIDCDKYIIIAYHKKKKHIMKIDRRNKDGKRIQKETTLMLLTDEIDWKKMKASIQANIIHILDATWLQNTVILCSKSDIKSLLALFDCLGCRFEDIDLVLYNFKLALKELFSNKDQLEILLLTMLKSVKKRDLSNVEILKIKDYVNKNVNIDF